MLKVFRNLLKTHGKGGVSTAINTANKHFFTFSTGFSTWKADWAAARRVYGAYKNLYRKKEIAAKLDRERKDWQCTHAKTICKYLIIQQKYEKHRKNYLERGMGRAQGESLHKEVEKKPRFWYNADRLKKCLQAGTARKTMRKAGKEGIWTAFPAICRCTAGMRWPNC